MPRLLPQSGNPRRAALSAISATLDKGLHVQASLSKVLSSISLSERDTALCTELTYGYLRRKRTCEYLVLQFLAKPRKLPVDFIRLLALSTYEQVFLDRIPSYASTNSAVSLAKRMFGHSLSRVANGVLRRIASIADEASTFSYYQTRLDRTQTLGTFYSCPDWIVAKISNWLSPAELEDFLRATITAPPVGVRINPSHPSAHDVCNTLSSRHDVVASTHAGFAMSSTPSMVSDLTRNGVLSLQSLASISSLALLDGQNVEGPVLDLCAGRGGKTTYLMERGLTDMVACDLSFSRLSLLPAELTRLSLPSIPLVHLDATRPLPFKSTFNTVLVDAPCSGIGVFSRRPDTKWKLTAKAMDIFPATQKRILSRAAEVVSPGGHLVYVTCTINPNENMATVQSFLQGNPSYILVEHAEPIYSHPLHEFFFTAILRKRMNP